MTSEFYVLITISVSLVILTGCLIRKQKPVWCKVFIRVMLALADVAVFYQIYVLCKDIAAPHKKIQLIAYCLGAVLFSVCFILAMFGEYDE